jgi:UDP-N-acetylglucosamine--N-acetylmuramyl-(pentapeptide) pyrophosphoryl-undecaprenol N-acetylglucosamine transferase
LSVVLAGGGTAGHVEPAMAVADALVALDPTVRITALGTARGLETKLVPERGYHLELITPVPLPRKPTGDLARLPPRVLRAVRQTRAVLDKVDADVVIGFGGYVALPAYLAARGTTRRSRRVAVVIHEANASAGLANRVGAPSAQRVLSAVPDPGLKRAEVVGVPVREAITSLDRTALRGRTSALPMTPGCCWCSAARREPRRSTARSPRRPASWRRPGCRCCTPTAPRTPSICASRNPATRRTSRCRI